VKDPRLAPSVDTYTAHLRMFEGKGPGSRPVLDDNDPLWAIKHAARRYWAMKSVAPKRKRLAKEARDIAGAVGANIDLPGP